MINHKIIIGFLSVIVLNACGTNPGDSNQANVEQVLEKPATFVNKTTRLKGVVSQVDVEKQLFSVISEKEFNECGIADCNVNDQLPVRFGGDFPQMGHSIEIVGQVKRQDKGFIYEAESIKSLENLSK